MIAQWLAAIVFVGNVFLCVALVVYLSRRRAARAEELSKGFVIICLLVGMTLMAVGILAGLLIPGLAPDYLLVGQIVAIGLGTLCSSASVFSDSVGRWWAGKLAARSGDFLESPDGDAVRTEAVSPPPAPPDEGGTWADLVAIQHEPRGKS